MRQKNGNPSTNPIFGIVPLVIGLVFLYSVGIDTNVSCSRSSNLCIIKKSNIFGPQNTKYINISGLIGAKIDSKQVESYERDYNSSSRCKLSNGSVYLRTMGYRVVLSTHQGIFPLTDYSYNLDKCNEDIQKINHFLTARQEKLDINYHSNLYIRILGFILVVLGLGVFIISLV